MRKPRILIPLILGVFLFLNCKGPRDVVKSSFFPIQPVTVDYDFEMPIEFDQDHEVYGVSLRDDLLILNVKYYYSGELHTFDLVTNGLYKKTLPPVVHLFLRAEEKGEGGDKLVFQELQFDISEIRKWGTDQIVLRILGYPNVLIYRFKK